MSRAQIATFVCVAAPVTAIVTLVLAGVPFLARLAFRARLTQIRDDTVDAILDGRLRRTEAVDGFINTLALTVDLVCAASLVDNVLTTLAYCGQRLSRPTAQLFIGNVASLNPGEREIMREFGTRACGGYQSFIIWASPIGWLIAPAVLIGRWLTPGVQPAHARVQGSVRRETIQDTSTRIGPDERKTPYQRNRETPYASARG